MNDLTYLKKDLIKKTLLISIPIFLLLIGLGKTVVAGSFIFGVIISWLNFYLSAKDLSNLTILGQGASGKLLKSYFLRYFVLFLSLTIVFLYKLNITAFIIGFFEVKLLLVALNARLGR